MRIRNTDADADPQSYLQENRQLPKLKFKFSDFEMTDIHRYQGFYIFSPCLESELVSDKERVEDDRWNSVRSSSFGIR